MSERRPDDGPEPDRDFWGEPLAGPLTYIIAIAAYALLGMEFHWLLSWTRGFIFAFVAIWLIPHLWRRWRG